MAQLNMRVPDEHKEIAEAVTRSAGFGLGEYLGTIISYIAAHRTLPVVIKSRPVAVKPEEAFQQAIVKFRRAYMLIQSLCEDLLVVGQLTPLDALREPGQAIDAAQEFYEREKSLIALAPGQLERLPGVDAESVPLFARCHEHFPRLAGFLRTAIRMAYMNNRPINAHDLTQMHAALEQAAEHINQLQSMAEGGLSAEARSAFFIRDVEEALVCATRATRDGEAYLVSMAWKDRMAACIRQAEFEFQGLGVVKHLGELALSWEKLQALEVAVDHYLAQASAQKRDFDDRAINDLKRHLIDVKEHIRPRAN